MNMHKVDPLACLTPKIKTNLRESKVVQIHDKAVLERSGPDRFSNGTYELAGLSLEKQRSIVALPMFFLLVLEDMRATMKFKPGWKEKYKGAEQARVAARECIDIVMSMIPPKNRNQANNGSSLRISETCKKHLNGDGSGRDVNAYIYSIYQAIQLIDDSRLWRLPACKKRDQYAERFSVVTEIMFSWVNQNPDYVERWQKGSMKTAKKMLEDWQKNGLFKKSIRFD